MLIKGNYMKTTMKHLLLFILTIAAFSSKGQDRPKETQTSDFRKVQIGINVSPDICYRTLKNNDGSSTSDLIMKLDNENQTAKVGYTAGLNVCFSINKFFGLETGIQFSNKGYQTKFTDLIFEQPENSSLPDKAKFIYNFHCIDIPIKANFTIGEKKIRFFHKCWIDDKYFDQGSINKCFGLSRPHRQKNKPNKL
jgi:hypothetical protein